mmetsp:Transcript_16192/g.34013  ORF Transcript_16192/g.34013 Transcript_16192/m.34013 type:complete len:97 (-) Transcript_16192:280-570(-)
MGRMSSLGGGKVRTRRCRQQRRGEEGEGIVFGRGGGIRGGGKGGCGEGDGEFVESVWWEFAEWAYVGGGCGLDGVGGLDGTEDTSAVARGVKNAIK